MRWIGALPLLFSSSFALAQEPIDSCAPLASYKDILRCAETKSFDVQRAEAEERVARAGIQTARQRPNPELAASAVTGKIGAENQSETDLTLGFPIELGGKRAARVAAAESHVVKAEAEASLARTSTKASVLLKLHRLRQVLREIHIIDESLSTFSRLVRQYERRPQLTPEQQITVSVFRVAQNEYKMRKIQSEDELARLGAFFKLLVGLEAERIRTLLPPAPSSWPKIEPGGSQSTSPRLSVLEAEVKSARAERGRAESEAWPTLTVGPSVRFSSEGAGSGQLYGVNLSLPLPLLNRNQGGRAQAIAGEQAAELRRSLGAREISTERETLLTVYQRSVEILRQSLSPDELEKRHRSVETLFFRGVVPGTLVIEAHRSLVDFEKSRNERELAALEALLGLYVIDGKIGEVEL